MIQIKFQEEHSMCDLYSFFTSASKISTFIFVFQMKVRGQMDRIEYHQSGSSVDKY